MRGSPLSRGNPPPRRGGLTLLGERGARGPSSMLLPSSGEVAGRSEAVGCLHIYIYIYIYIYIADSIKYYNIIVIVIVIVFIHVFYSRSEAVGCLPDGSRMCPLQSHCASDIIARIIFMQTDCQCVTYHVLYIACNIQTMKRGYTFLPLRILTYVISLFRL